MISPYSGAPFRLNNAMSFTCYLEITVALRFTDVRTPTVERDGYKDRFHEVRKMIDEFNNHYTHSYHPLWLNCLDESMNDSDDDIDSNDSDDDGEESVLVYGTDSSDSD